VKPAEIEKRVSVLEEELASLKKQVAATGAREPWWERIAGTFENDPVYQRAMKLGRQYRQSLKPGKPPRKGK
jgi:hypothetical protein